MRIVKNVMMLFGLAFVFISCTGISGTKPVSIFLLKSWEFKDAQDSVWLPAVVPGTVHTDLLKNGIIEDPFYRTNEKSLQWIDKKDWEYRTTFSIPDSLLKMNHLVLNFQGLDTYADVYLNDQLILNADNFFRSWQIDVKSLLKEGNNLRIYFHSPIKIGFKKQQQNGYILPATNDQSENGEVGENKLSVFARKPGYHFGWDWGPRFVTSGIWKPIELIAWNVAKIESVFFDQKSVDKSRAELQVEVEISADKAGSVGLKLFSNGTTLSSQSISLIKGKNVVSFPVTIDHPTLWWTYELGEPHLYDFEVQVLDGNALVDRYSEKIGLRSIEVVREEDKEGTSFYFKLNGVPIFAKGANYIPQDAFLPRVTDSLYLSLIQSAKSANMNMLRVWGGGIYEKDIFYQLCDKNGIMVWQDFMFACSMYPGDADFLENARLEAVENVRRLRNHACISIYAGNNEIEVAWGKFTPWGGWGWQKAYNQDQKDYIWHSYDTLFNQILPKVVAENTSGTFYIPTSPYDGEGRNSGNDSKNGDVHYWGVWHGEHDFEEFNDYIGRFMSEFGFQSFPNFNTIKKFTLPEDWDIESNVMASHQRSGIGNLRIKSYMDKYYQLPHGFEDMLYVGQVLQAEGMKVGFEAHRRAKPYCMGSLYWQINDCWPVASWSGMDYYQNWKGLHYFVKKAFEPILVSPFVEDGKLTVKVVSDRLDSLKGILDLSIISFSGEKLWSHTKKVTLLPNASQTEFEEQVNKIVSWEKGRILLVAQFKVNNQVLGENLLYFTKTKNLDLSKPVISQQLDSTEETVRITIQSDVLAKNVFLEFEGTEGHFSDNYFDLLPRMERVITFKPNKDWTNPALKIKTIRDTY